MIALSRLRYRAPVGPPLSTALFSLALLGGFVGLTLSLIQGGPWAFMVLWLLVIGGVAFGQLFLTCHEVSIQDGLLRWRSAFRHGTMPMDQVVRVSTWPGGSVHVFECRGGEKVRIAVMQGYVTFLQQLREAYPELPIPHATYAEFVDQVRVSTRDYGSGVPHEPRDEPPTP